jgi:hypothetical protein
MIEFTMGEQPMESSKLFLVSVVFLVLLVLCPQPARSEDFPLSIKGWQATVIRLEGVNTSNALAVGQVQRRNAEEYCEREAEWLRDKKGGKFNQEKCIRDILRKERGRLYSASADCPRKIMQSHIGSFTLVGQTYEHGITQNLWRNNVTGQVLDGSNASGAPLLDAQFELLCPAFIKP